MRATREVVDYMSESVTFFNTLMPGRLAISIVGGIEASLTPLLVVISQRQPVLTCLLHPYAIESHHLPSSVSAPFESYHTVRAE